MAEAWFVDDDCERTPSVLLEINGKLHDLSAATAARLFEESAAPSQTTADEHADVIRDAQNTFVAGVRKAALQESSVAARAAVREQLAVFGIDVASNRPKAAFSDAVAETVRTLVASGEFAVVMEREVSGDEARDEVRRIAKAEAYAAYYTAFGALHDALKAALSWRAWTRFVAAWRNTGLEGPR